jgi:RNA-splicing ligase RtcB
MPGRVHNSPNLIYSAGTQVVTRKPVQGSTGRVVHPSGAVGVIVKSPRDRSQKDLEKKGVRVLSAGADEVPGVYKDIAEVMREQADLVEIVARFDPRIVKMCDDGSKAED